MNSNGKCGRCLWGDTCPFGEPCAYFAPIWDEIGDAAIGHIIEERRDEFRREFFRYISDDN